MLIDDVNVSRADVHYVPLLPVTAQGGSLTEFEAQVKEYDCEKIISPIRDAELAVPVTGDSMSPEYASGCRVLVRNKESEDRIVCRSVNPNYQDFEIEKTDIRGWYRVLMEISLK